MTDFYEKYYKQLVGATILGFRQTNDDDAGEQWPTFLIRLDTGAQVTVTLSCDEEGNRPGFAFIEEVKG